MLSSVPRVWLMRMLANLLGPRSREIGALLETGVRRLATGGTGVLKVKGVAGELGASPRRLERLCAVEKLPPPKRLLRDLTLVFVTFRGYVLELPVTASARRAGLSRKALSQLRHDVLGQGEPWGRLPAGEQFGLAIASLARGCAAASRKVQAVIEDARRRMA